MANKFSWTEEYKKTWEDDLYTREYVFKRINRNLVVNKKAVVRHLLFVIDVSFSIEKTDFLPNIRTCVFENLQKLEKSFYSSNPLSILSFLIINDSKEVHSKVVPSLLYSTTGKGYFSFNKCLKSSIKTIKDSSYLKEVVLITASTNTKDNGEYQKIIKELCGNHIKFNIVNLSGEVTLFKRISDVTKGKYYVPMDIFHFKFILESFAFPNESISPKASLLTLGFTERQNKGMYCFCHLIYQENPYFCPDCKTPVCHVPTQCPVCELHLVSPLDIYKSHNFMFSFEPFEKLNNSEFLTCFVCGDRGNYDCSKCKTVYCEKCNYNIQDALNFCIGCNHNDSLENKK